MSVQGNNPPVNAKFLAVCLFSQQTVELELLTVLDILTAVILTPQPE
jgi:hypothetical protein